eukprot:6172109-Pleurochrysis_carterae.AAC.4
MKEARVRKEPHPAFAAGNALAAARAPNVDNGDNEHKDEEEEDSTKDESEHRARAKSRTIVNLDPDFRSGPSGGWRAWGPGRGAWCGRQRGRRWRRRGKVAADRCKRDARVRDTCRIDSGRAPGIKKTVTLTLLASLIRSAKALSAPTKLSSVKTACSSWARTSSLMPPSESRRSSRCDNAKSTTNRMTVSREAPGASGGNGSG